MAQSNLIEAGWAALGRGSWEEARLLFEKAVSEDPTAEAVEGYSWAAWWTNDAPATFEARERAYALYREAGDLRGAARMAMWLGTDCVDFRGELAVGLGWLGRARRLLENVPESSEHGWLWVHEAEKEMYQAGTVRARELGARAAELGGRIGIVDLQMMGLASEGIALIAEAEVQEGMARLDEAAAAALGGEFSEIWAVGWSCCYLIQACEQVRDYERAGQWCRRLEEWSRRMDVKFLNRVCRAHYAGLLVSGGRWRKAEEELLECVARLAELRPPMAADATVRLAELRRRQGRLEEALEMFEEVIDHPLALLGLGEVHLDRGEPAAARDRAEQYLRETPVHAGTVRAPGLELLVRALVALDDLPEAELAMAELETVTAQLGTQPVIASARFSSGLISFASGDIDAARQAFEDATRLFHASGAPFEAARARIELARTLRAAGRPGDALRELRGATTTLQRIGAVHRLGEAASPGSESRKTGGSALTEREREILRLVATGMSDRTIATQLVLSEHTVHRHVANILTKLGSANRSAAVAEALTNNML